MNSCVDQHQALWLVQITGDLDSRHETGLFHLPSIPSHLLPWHPCKNWVVSFSITHFPLEFKTVEGKDWVGERNEDYNAWCYPAAASYWTVIWMWWAFCFPKAPLWADDWTSVWTQQMMKWRSGGSAWSLSVQVFHFLFKSLFTSFLSKSSKMQNCIQCPPSHLAWQNKGHEWVCQTEHHVFCLLWQIKS